MIPTEGVMGKLMALFRFAGVVGCSILTSCFSTLGWDSTSADGLGFFADSVSRLNRSAALYATTLQDFLKTLPGERKITANFPEAIVEIAQLAEARKQPTALFESVSPS